MVLRIRKLFLAKLPLIRKNWRMVVVMLVVVGAGSWMLIASHAASSFVASEVEDGTLSGPASVLNDATASAGAAVKFGGGSTGTARIPELPFDIPSKADLAASAKDVLGYYHSVPLYGANATSYDENMSPNGNGGSYYSVGGRWRQRPYPFVDSSNLTATKRTTIMAQDVAEAANIGIDAFLINVNFSPSDTKWNTYLLPMYDGADQYNASNDPDFHVAVDLSMNAMKNRAAAEQEPVFWADKLAPLLARSTAYKYKGKPAMSIYQIEEYGPQWYKDFAARLKNAHGLDLYILASFQGNDASTTLAPYVTAGLFPSLMPTIHQWAQTSPTTDPSNIQANTRNWAASHNTTYMGTLMVFENDRPSNQKALEGYGFQILQNMWLASIQHNDSIFKLVSWNDHEESHNVRPSTGYQWAPYDVTAYYLTWFKTGQKPQITRDTIFYAHRMQKFGATYDKTKQPLPYNFSGIAAPVDKVFTYAFLKAPADVKVVSGGTVYTHSNVAAGATLLSDPLAVPDQPKFSASRNGNIVVPEFSSPFRTRSSVVWQDLLYRMGGSNRPIITNNGVPVAQTDMPSDRL